MTESRRLTPDETRAAQTVFGPHLDYAAVRIHRGLPLLPQYHTAVSPNGRIYFPQTHYLPDYTRAAPGYTLWLIHELTHVWQWQHGFKTWLGGLILAARGGYLRRRAYRCPPLHEIRRFSDLNMEQQAETLARCYAVLHSPHTHTAVQNDACRRILQQFSAQTPSDKLLPRYFAAMRKIK
ncbi:Uncharacterised protein [Kingella potus]|uniref:Type IV secretion protein Rhs n=1 Tax=Kingella potus TaxID=265175 RepID=A0A377R5U7_9NEIS|nr:type IV secretion protein Rhs [Kingella potus]UOP00062.1 type IV secretion protein Rhs [Kingella potus]STR03352.1 Uncharacterised protein [Kingella potus]